MSLASSEMIKVVEVFGPTIQGEGALIGKPTLFVRTGGCDYRCVWCDSMHAVDPQFREQWVAQSDEQILSALVDLASPPIWITLSGGNPAIQPFQSLIPKAKAMGYRLAMETQGSVAKTWFKELDHLILSPKPPSSRMSFDSALFERCLSLAPNSRSLKMVVFDEKDLGWAKQTADRYPSLACYIQPGNPNSDPETLADKYYLLKQMDWLVNRTAEMGWYDVTILPQLHVLIWDNERGK